MNGRKIVFPALLISVIFPSVSYSNVINVNGVALTYIVRNGEACIGDGKQLAIPADVERVQIPSSISGYSVTAISDNAFRSHSVVKVISLPAGVRKIGLRAFECCSCLNSINLPEGITEVGAYAFYECRSLGKIMLPSSIETIGKDAFYQCSGVEGPLPAALKRVEEEAFYDCSGLKGDITIPSGVTEVGAGAFCYDSGISRITVSEGVKYIGTMAFYKCGSLDCVELPDGLYSINDGAFRDCNIDVLTIPETVSYIGVGAFYSCNTIYVADDDVLRVKSMLENGGLKGKAIADIVFRSIKTKEVLNVVQTHDEVVNGINWTYVIKSEGVCVGGESQQITAVPKNTSGEIAIPTTLGGIQVKGICDYAFKGCSYLTAVKIPAGVKSIGWGSFMDCYELQTIYIPRTVTSI